MIRLLAIIFLVYLLFRLAARFLFPLAARYFVKKATSNMEERMKSQSSGKKVYEDGKVEIRQMPKSKGEAGSNGSTEDYIDFEEIDD